MNDNTPIEGQIKLTLCCAQGRVARVLLQSSRPLYTPRIFIGKRADEVLTTLPMLYSVCGTAQSLAAVGAFESALGYAVSNGVLQRRCMLLEFETVRETLWRIHLDWPGLMGEDADAAGLARLAPLQRQFRKLLDPQRNLFSLTPDESCSCEDSEAFLRRMTRLTSEELFAGELEAFCELHSEAGLRDWMAGCQAISARMLRWLYAGQRQGCAPGEVQRLPDRLPGDWLQQQFTEWGDAFIATPRWQGACAETGAFAWRRNHPLVAQLIGVYGAGLLARYVARLLDLAIRLRQLRDQAGAGCVSRAMRFAQGDGIAQVQAARGLLVHRVQLDNGKVTDYRILAPTEWNFHPDGVVAQALTGRSTASHKRLRETAELLINSVDPCVGYQLEIRQE